MRFHLNTKIVRIAKRLPLNRSPNPSRYRGWRAITLAAAIGVTAGMLAGCWSIPPNVPTTQDNPVPVAKHFPAALLAEPIRLRAGYTHTTQPFQIKGTQERWVVALGFVTVDAALTTQQRLAGGADTCWIDSPGKGLRPKACKNTTPGFNLHWELLRADGTVAEEFEFDSLSEDSGGTYGANSVTRTLSGFSNQSAGFYRLRVVVLRDANELDFLRPHILVNKPFFRSKAIE